MALVNIVEDDGWDLGPVVDRGPGRSRFVNHLPMGQAALWRMGQDEERVRRFSEHYLKRNNVVKNRTGIPPAASLADCLGKEERYEACLGWFHQELSRREVDDLIGEVLNRWPRGLSGGLFHVTIRLAYAWDGWQENREYKREVARALAYYVTYYRETPAYGREVDPEAVPGAVSRFLQAPAVRSLADSGSSLGTVLKELAGGEDPEVPGFRVGGTMEEAAGALLGFLTGALVATPNIVVLHCITGLHGFWVLRDHFERPREALDLLTAAMLHHLVIVEDLAWTSPASPDVLSWADIWASASQSSDVHTIKLAYTGRELDRLFGLPGLRAAWASWAGPETSGLTKDQLTAGS